MTADEYYQLGNEYRRKGDWKHALDNYMEAIELDSESPAVEAKRMLDDIMSYYCKDMYVLSVYKTKQNSNINKNKAIPLTINPDAVAIACGSSVK